MICGFLLVSKSWNASDYKNSNCKGRIVCLSSYASTSRPGMVATGLCGCRSTVCFGPLAGAEKSGLLISHIYTPLVGNVAQRGEAMKGADIFVESLLREGVDTIFGHPGG